MQAETAGEAGLVWELPSRGVGVVNSRRLEGLVVGADGVAEACCCSCMEGLSIRSGSMMQLEGNKKWRGRSGWKTDDKVSRQDKATETKKIHSSEEFEVKPVTKQEEEGERHGGLDVDVCLCGGGACFVCGMRLPLVSKSGTIHDGFQQSARRKYGPRQSPIHRPPPVIQQKSRHDTAMCD